MFSHDMSHVMKRGQTMGETREQSVQVMINRKGRPESGKFLLGPMTPSVPQEAWPRGFRFLAAKSAMPLEQSSGVGELVERKDKRENPN